MSEVLQVYNTLTRKKEPFQPINPPYVGMYVCGPTVYSDVHLGNVRTFLGFDVIYRYLLFSGYKVRYVRNITDVGHLLDDSGEDRVLKQAKLMQLEPMEVAQKYTNDFHSVLKMFNNKAPGIEPLATGHIIEQIEMTKKILDAGYAYEINGSVYFDVEKYNADQGYGHLSGRKIEDLIANTRELDGQSDKKNPLDFALWKNAAPEHIIRWPSPWGEGFPGWHLECSVMSTKYLGIQFDIHGGGMDLKFPHHECEIAQNQSAHGSGGPKYWLHSNMLTVNSQKMSKSLGNGFLPHELITGDHPLLERGYSPMTVRFFMLQTHYRSTLDFSNEALLAAAKGYKKIANGLKTIKAMEYPSDAKGEADEKLISDVNRICEQCQEAMNDDFNTALTLGHLFNLLKKINSLNTGQLKYSDFGPEAFTKVKSTYLSYVEDVLGLIEEKPDQLEAMLSVIIDLYKQAKESKEYDKVDQIRNGLKEQGIILKDMKSGVGWAYEE
ncbi:MAG: cysteine--tRNA ligase [Cyclobacteriaceae bacterium]